MKFVALISGGKDSCFNILHCISNGHELVAIANLHPPETNEFEEMDSWMFQTVGYQVVKQYDKVLGVPLYRRPISNSSKVQSLSYTKTEGDETEDLYKLLQDVLEKRPDIAAVSSGAILSSYQRIRVENVCQRLGLTSLAFLWQRPQNELLDEIIDSGLNAIIVKTAAVGLDRSHLGKTLAQMRPLLTQLHDIYDLHICGEGGEYETLVLGGPSSIYKGQLMIEESHVVDHSSGDVAYLSLKVKYVANEPEPESDQADVHSADVRAPPLLSEEFSDIHQEASEVSLHDSENSFLQGIASSTLEIPGNKASLLNIVASTSSAPSSSIEDEATQAFEKLLRTLNSLGKSTKNIAFISLLLDSMDDFAVINSVYSRYFPFSNPPARACIQVKGLSSRLKLSAYLLEDAESREGLHVQSTSYWAPANIGPYSQLISSGRGFAFCAGQIGLIPSKMQLPTSESEEIVLALQNLYRVLQVSNISFGPTVAFANTKNRANNVKCIAEVWKSASQLFQSDPVFTRSDLLIVEVAGLPRNANVEWLTIGIDGPYWQAEKYKRDSNDEDDNLVFPIQGYTSKSSDRKSQWELSFGSFTSITAAFNHVDEFTSFMENTSAAMKQVYTVIYTSQDPQGTQDLVEKWSDIADIIPANGIYDLQGQLFKIGVLLLIEALPAQQHCSGPQ